MDDVINAGRANYELDLMTIPSDLQLGSTSFSNNQEVSENDGEVYQKTNRINRYRNKSNSSSAIGRPSQLIKEDRNVSKVYDSTKNRVLKTSNGIPLNPSSFATNAKSYVVRPFQASIEIADAFSEELDRLKQLQGRLDKVNGDEGSQQSWLSQSTSDSIDQPQENLCEEEEEDSVVEQDESSEVEEEKSKDQVDAPDISHSKQVKLKTTTELPYRACEVQKKDKIVYMRSISELQRELDCLKPGYTPYRHTSARNAKPMKSETGVSLSQSASNIHLSNSDGMKNSKSDLNSGPTSGVSTLRSDSTASEKSSKSPTFKLFPSSGSFSSQKSKTKEPKKSVIATQPPSSTNKKSSFSFAKSMYRSKKNKSKSSDHIWTNLAGPPWEPLEGISEVSGSEILTRKGNNVASVPTISVCSTCNRSVDISNPSSFLCCTNCGAAVHEDEACRAALDLAGCHKGVANSKKKKMSLAAAFSGGGGGGGAGGGSNSSGSKRKLCARNSVTGASSVNAGSASSIGGASMSREGSYSALPHVNSLSSLSNGGSSGQLHQLYSPSSPTSEFNLRQTGSIKEVEDEKDSGMVSFDTESIASGHTNHYRHPNNFASPPSSVHMRSTSMMTSLSNNHHPSSSSHSSSTASSSTATTVHNSVGNRHSFGFNIAGGQSRRSSSPSFANIYKPKSTPDLFSSVDKLGHLSTEFGDESDSKPSRFRLELQRGGNNSNSSSIEEWQMWGWASSSAANGSGGGGEMEWIKQVPQHVLNSLPNYTIQQQSAIQELIVTEVNFITNLDIVEDIYIYNIVNNIDWDQWHITKAMGSARNERVVEILFGPPEVRKSLRSLSRRLIIALCELRENCRQDGSYVMDASNVLEKHFCEDQNREVYINAYHHLTAGQNKAKKFYDEAMESVPVFAKFMRDCSNAPLLRRKTLLDTRTAITQRPHKYPALLSSLLHNTNKELADIKRISTQSDDVTGVTSQKQGNKNGVVVNESEILEKKARLLECEKSIEQILGQLNSKLMEFEMREKFENFMSRTDSKVVVLNVPRKDTKDRDDKKETMEEKYDKNRLQDDEDLLLLADFSVKLINSEMSKHKCVHFLVMNKCVVLLEIKDPGSSNSQYALLSVPKQRPVIRAESLKISFSETLSEEQAHLIDTDQPILNVITCKSRSEKNKLAKACNSIQPVKENVFTGGNNVHNDATANTDQPKNHSFKKSHSSAAASSSNPYKRLAVSSNHRSHSQPKSQGYHANAILERNSAMANNYSGGPTSTVLSSGPSSNHLGLPKSAISTLSSNGTGSPIGSNEILHLNDSSMHASADEQHFAESSILSGGTASVNHEHEVRRIISARAELCHNQLAQLLHELSHQGWGIEDLFLSMNESESENLKKNISLLMGDLSHLKSSFLTSAFTGASTRMGQHPVVSRSQSCKLPLEGSNGGHKMLAGAVGASAECSSGRVMSTGVAKRHATFTSKDANRNCLDLDVSSASSDISRKVEINCTCGSGANEKVAKLEAELEATRKELIKSKTEILQTQLNFFVKESKLKEDIERVNQRWNLLNDTSDWRKSSVEDFIMEDDECNCEGDFICENHQSEYMNKFDPVYASIQPLSSSTMRGAAKEFRSTSKFLHPDITASTPDAKSADMSFNYQHNRQHAISHANKGGFNGPSSFPGVEAVTERSFRNEGPTPMSPTYNNKSLDSSFNIDTQTPKASACGAPILSPQSSTRLRRGNHVNNKPKTTELKQQLPTKLLMNTSMSGTEVKKNAKASQSSSVAPKISVDRAKIPGGNMHSNLHSRRRGGNSPSLTLQYDATPTGGYAPYSHNYSSSDWEAANEFRAVYESPGNSSVNLLDDNHIRRRNFSSPSFGMLNSIRDGSGKEESSSPNGAYGGMVDELPTREGKNVSPEETSKQAMFNKGKGTSPPVYML